MSLFWCCRLFQIFVRYFFLFTGNKNYPNPPAWGYSLWVNGQESPVLVVERGKTYTFNVAAGPTHPVYITSSIIGGGLLVDYAGETILAGNDTTFGKCIKFDL